MSSFIGAYIFSPSVEWISTLQESLDDELEKARARVGRVLQDRRNIPQFRKLEEASIVLERETELNRTLLSHIANLRDQVVPQSFSHERCKSNW